MGISPSADGDEGFTLDLTTLLKKGRSKTFSFLKEFKIRGASRTLTIHYSPHVDRHKCRSSAEEPSARLLPIHSFTIHYFPLRLNTFLFALFALCCLDLERRQALHISLIDKVRVLKIPKIIGAYKIGVFIKLCYAALR